MYQPMSVVVTAFKETDVKNALKGFGVLVPRKEQKNGFFTLGKLFKILIDTYRMFKWLFDCL